MTQNPLTPLQQFLERSEMTDTDFEKPKLLTPYDYSLWTRLSDFERMVVRDMYKENLIPVNSHTIKAFWERRGIS